MRFLLFVGLSPVSIGFLPFGIYRIYAEKLALKMRKNLDFIEVFCLGIFFSALLWWSWGELNPRPKDDPQEHLRAQYAIYFHYPTGHIRPAKQLAP